MQDLKHVFSYLKPYRRDLFLAVGLVFVECIFEMVIPMLMSDLVDQGVPSHDMQVIMLQGSKMIICAVLALITGLLYARFAARTLLKHPKVLIFDDSTSAVDTATEGKIRHALAALTDVTKLIIAQRITSVMDADMIVILDDGKVHAVGTHKELLANDTIYQEIYASQMKGDDADGKGIQR